MTERAQLEERESNCATVADFAALITDALEDPADKEYAEELAGRAEGLCVEVEDTVAYAGILKALDKDASDIRSALEEAEMDCQFTKQFVALARGFRDYCGDEDRMRELMDQAEEFCMTDEEQIDLGDGFQILLGDSARAAECYEKGLAGVQDREALLALAEKFAGPLDNPELARTVYARAEEKSTSGNDLRKLAQSMREHLRDDEAVGAVYQRASERLTAVNDLINLAADSLELGLKDLAEQLYRKVLGEASDYAQVLKLVAPLQEMGDAQELIGTVLERAGELAEDSTQVLDVAVLAHEADPQAPRVRQLLARAEEMVTSLGELTAVSERVAALAGDDAEWRGRLDEKMEKRQANQARYNAFQDQEQKADTPLQFMQLATQVMEELEDAFYARKLLDTARQMLESSPGDTNLHCLLARTMDTLLEDADSCHAILQQAADAAESFSSLRLLAQAACNELRDQDAGQQRARSWYQSWQSRLDGSDAYASLRLARAVWTDLNDAEFALKVTDSIAADARDAMILAQMGLLAQEAGNATRAEELFREALQDAGSETAISVMRLLCDARVDTTLLRSLYESAAPEEAAQRLRWTEGILEVFGDREWGERMYAEMTDAASDPALAARLALSRDSRLGRLLIR